MTSTARPLPNTSDFVWRFGASAFSVIVVLTILAPLRHALVSLTVWSVESSASVVQLNAWKRDSGLIAFTSPSGGAFSYNIVEECTAAAVVGLFTVAVLAAPAIDWRRRIIGVVAGSAALFAANWIRLLSLAWIGVHHPATFNLAHVWLWQIVSIAVVVVTWLAWLHWATGQSTSSEPIWRRAAWFIGSVVLVGGILQLTGLGYRYSNSIDGVIRGVQHALNSLPYRPISIARSADEWVRHTRSVSLALVIALTAVLTGPTTRKRLISSVRVLPLVFAVHLLGTLVEAAAAARLGFADQMTIGRHVQIPLLVVVHGLPTLLPLVLWYRSSPTDKGNRVYA